MTQLYLGVGHGITPKGAFDQGAQAPGRNEYELNWRVVAAAAIALERCGISFINEEAAGKGHDPDFVGSANNANDAHVQLAIEVHHNASDPPHPGFRLRDVGLLADHRGKPAARPAHRGACCTRSSASTCAGSKACRSAMTSAS